MNLFLLKDRLSVSRLTPDDDVPAWAFQSGGFTSVTRTAEELCIVCDQGSVPPGTKSENGWRILKFEGPLDFALTGILLAVVRPLAEAGISIFAMSTFDTDYVMLKEENVATAVSALEAAGHRIEFE